ncbi:MAG TPA: peptidyl-prolyl cis-trans isomerase [Pirellulales bacterium]|nr:peptidyl-prolyl cis-trans isomerase [Pirellulales bacterium]
MSRLFYPTLFSVTAALAATLWVRHGLPMHWLTALVETAAAQAQTPADGNAAPPPNGAVYRGRPAPQRLPPTGKPPAAPPGQPSRARQTPFTQLQIDPSGAGALEVTRPVPIPSAKVVAKFGNEVILAADVLPAVQEEFKHLARQVPPEQHDQFFQMVMAKHVKSLLQTKLVVQEMKKNVPEGKFPEMEKQILQHFEKERLPEMKKKLGVTTESEVDAKLKEYGTSLKEQRKSFVEMILVQEWMRKDAKFDEHVSHEQMLAFYHEHHREYEFPAKVRFEQIHVNYGRRRGRQEAWELARRLGYQVYSGAPMAEIAKVHSEGAKADQGGLHDWTSKGSLKCKELDAALFSLPVGVLSNPIDDGRGFTIVRVVQRTEAGATSFRDAQAGIKVKITEQRGMDARNKAITAFFEKMKTKVWTAYDDMPEPKAQNAKKPTNRMLR